MEAVTEEKKDRITFLSVENKNVWSLRAENINNYPNLVRFNAQRNSISLLGEKVFETNPKLAEINLQRNRLTYIRNSWFRNAPVLVHLDLSHNKIHVLTPYMFPCTLETLFLHHNKIYKIFSGTFNDLPMLKNLNLSNNEIDLKNHQDYFDHNRNLNSLNLRCNKCVRLPFRTLPDRNPVVFTNLTALDLMHNRIPDVTETTFSIVPNLQTLYVNVTESFTFRALNRLDALVRFDLKFDGPDEISFKRHFKNERFLSNANLTSFSLTAKRILIDEQIRLQTLTNLESFSICATTVARENLGMFNCAKQVNGMKHLERLALRSNYNFMIFDRCPSEYDGYTVEYLDLTGLGNHKISRFLNSFGGLTTLNLSYSKIEKFRKDAFSSQTKLKRLYLNNSRLRTIKNEYFKCCFALETLNLKDCALCKIEDDSFTSLLNLKQLNLKGNPIVKKKIMSFNGVDPSVIIQDLPKRTLRPEETLYW